MLAGTTAKPYDQCHHDARDDCGNPFPVAVLLDFIDQVFSFFFQIVVHFSVNDYFSAKLQKKNESIKK